MTHLTASRNLFLALFLLFSATAYAQQKKTTFRNPPGLFDPAPYSFSHVAAVPTGSTLVFIAGQGGETADGQLVPDYRSQVRQSLLNVQTALKATGLTIDDVARVTTLVVDHNEEKLNILVEEFRNVWPRGNFPANTLIPVPRLALDGMLVEIEATAVR